MLDPLRYMLVYMFELDGWEKGVELEGWEKGE